jgi:anti-anti-sigma regulatory factor
MQMAPGWKADVDRGPDWLFVRLGCDDPATPSDELGESLWNLLRCHLAHRMVVELDEVPRLPSHLLGQLVQLGKRIANSGGMMRLSGVSPAGKAAIEAARLDRLFPCYLNRTEAVMGNRPRQPR